MRRSPIAAALVFSLSACLTACSTTESRRAPRQTDPLPETELLHYNRCEQDEQCVFAQNGCCSCANGGAEAAVARDQVSAFRARFQCDDFPCREAGRDPPCGSGTVRCEAGRCVYQKPARPSYLPR